MTLTRHHDISSKQWMTGLIYVTLAQLLFGTTFAINKLVINQNVDPILMGFNRTWLAVVCLFPFYFFIRKSTRWNAKDWRLVFFIGAIATASAMILEYTGVQYTTASNVSLIISTEAVLAIFLAVLILKEKLYVPTIVGGIGALTGMILVMWDDVLHLEIHAGKALWGDLIILASVFCWCFYTVGGKRILERSVPLVAHFYIMLFSSMTLGIVSFTRGKWPDILQMNQTAWIGTLYLGILCSGLAHWLYFQALKRLPATMVSITLTLLPVFGVIFSVLILGETLSLFQIAGGCIIVLGVGYAVWPQEDQIPISDEVPPGT